MTSLMSSPEAGAAAAAASPDLEANGRTRLAASVNAPIFMENPDGTITEAVPSTYKAPKSRAKPAQAETNDDSTDSENSEVAAAGLYYDVEFLYLQHARVVTVLLFVHVFTSVLYTFVYVARMRDGSSVHEFMEMYAWDNRLVAERVLWVCFFSQAFFSACFYVVAGMALFTQRPSWYRQLASFGVAGIIGFVLLAYVDKFNLVVFFLHLLVYIYAKFLQGLTSSLMLLPPPPPPDRTAAQARTARHSRYMAV